MTGTGSSKPSNEPEPKEEQQNKDDKDSQDKDIYISVMFSVIPFDMMTSYRISEYKIGDRKFQGYTFYKSTKPQWENGLFNKNKIDKTLFIDCSEVIFNLDTGEVQDSQEMGNILVRTIDEVKSTASLSIKKGQNLNVHLIIGADSEVADLAYAMNYLCEKSMLANMNDKEFSGDVMSTYSKAFKQLEKRGCSFKVDYTALFDIDLVYAPAMPA
ncbi:MAG: hypothetical protein J5552_06370 [Prevotella sp.]|nr:hypothetical protein [Prevotella sp.]